MIRFLVTCRSEFEIVMRFLGIIPARYASTRFPGKALADIDGKSMIMRVYERACEALEEVFVATDDKRIFDHVQQNKGKVLMTDPRHPSGTDRVAEAVQILGNDDHNYEVVINIQGDEPFLEPAVLYSLMKSFEDPEVSIATPVTPVEHKKDVFNNNLVKVVLDHSDYALYFSRHAIPFIRDPGLVEKERIPFYQHIGIYAFRVPVLREITRLKPSLLEKAESLEQLRWLENGYRIKTVKVQYRAIGIDTPGDLERILKRMKEA